MTLFGEDFEVSGQGRSAGCLACPRAKAFEWQRSG
jgi:hypothetical protein